MGFFDFFKKESSSMIERLGAEVKLFFDEFFVKNSFFFEKQEITASNILELYYVAQDGRYIVVALFDSYTIAMISGEGDSGYSSFWDLDLILGKGNYDYPEQKWSSVPLKDFSSSLELKYGFNKKKELNGVLEKMRIGVSELGRKFIENDLEEFFDLRRERALAEPVTRFVIFDKETGVESVEVNQIEFKFKEKYSGPVNEI